MNQGWMCPGCNRCYSPTTPQCFTCGQPVYTKQQTNTGGFFKADFTLPDEMACKKKDCKVYAGGYCAKCHSEFY